MADDVQLPVTGTGTADVVVASDLISGVQHPRVKLQHGADGSAVDASATDPLPVGIKASTATLSNVTAAATSTTLIASNAARLGLVIYNDSTSLCYVKFGSSASATSFTYPLKAGGLLELGPLSPFWYTGIVTGNWVTADGGAARVTEMTA